MRKMRYRQLTASGYCADCGGYPDYDEELKKKWQKPDGG
jgi:hypothetical protein